jgi:hypothetical protein
VQGPGGRLIEKSRGRPSEVEPQLLGDASAIFAAFRILTNKVVILEICAVQIARRSISPRISGKTFAKPWEKGLAVCGRDFYVPRLK